MGFWGFGVLGFDVVPVPGAQFNRNILVSVFFLKMARVTIIYKVTQPPIDIDVKVAF